MEGGREGQGERKCGREMQEREERKRERAREQRKDDTRSTFLRHIVTFHFWQLVIGMMT